MDPQEQISPEIFEDIINDVIVGDRTIDVHVRKIRNFVGENNLKTIKGIGYGWFEKLNLENKKNTLIFAL